MRNRFVQGLVLVLGLAASSGAQASQSIYIDFSADLGAGASSSNYPSEWNTDLTQLAFKNLKMACDRHADLIRRQFNIPAVGTFTMSTAGNVPAMQSTCIVVY